MSLVRIRSHAALEHLLASIAEPVLVVDGAGEVVRASRAARDLVASGADPAERRSTGEPDARARANHDALRSFTRHPRGRRLHLFDLSRPDGEPVAFDVSAAQGEDDGLVLVLHDPRATVPASVAHELRTPLTAILGYASLLLKGLGGEPSPKQREKLERIHVNGERLLQLIDGLRELG